MPLVLLSCFQNSFAAQSGIPCAIRDRRSCQKALSERNTLCFPVPDGADQRTKAITKKREIFYHPIDLNEEMRSLVCTEKGMCTKVACELGVMLIAMKSLESSNRAAQGTDAQVTLRSGSSDPVHFLAARFMPSASFS